MGANLRGPMDADSELLQDGQPEVHRRRKMPEWAQSPFRDLLEYVENLWNVLCMSQDGISLLRARPRAIEVLARIDKALDGTEASERRRELEHAKKVSDLAEREVAADFPVLRAQYAVALWGSLESFLGRF